MLAAYPVISPFRGQELTNITVDALTLNKTSAYENWENRSDKLGRWGLLLVGLGTAAGAVAQFSESIARRRDLGVRR
jgi:hypothetical protein